MVSTGKGRQLGGWGLVPGGHNLHWKALAPPVFAQAIRTCEPFGDGLCYHCYCDTTRVGMK